MAGESPALVIVDPSGSNIANVNAESKLEVNIAHSSSLPSGSNPLGQVGIKAGESGDLSLESTQQDVSSSLVTIKDTVSLETTQQDVSSTLGTIRDTVALESTLQLVSSSLESIRLIDGVKKIEDVATVAIDYSNIRNTVHQVDAFFSEISATASYFMIIDLDNQGGSGPYFHSSSASGVKISLTTATLVKNQMAAEWDARIGVVTRIDSGSSDIAFLHASSLHARDTGQSQAEKKFEAFPLFFDLTLSGSDLASMVGRKTLGDTRLTTTDTIENPVGDFVAPAVGDVIMFIERVGGAGDSLVHYNLLYTVE